MWAESIEERKDTRKRRLLNGCWGTKNFDNLFGKGVSRVSVAVYTSSHVRSLCSQWAPFSFIYLQKEESRQFAK